jgi:hypothetical protein
MEETIAFLKDNKINSSSRNLNLCLLTYCVPKQKE